jgi:iron-sulfur cluster assembly protein
MISITPPAIAAMKSYLSAPEHASALGIRIALRGGGCSGFQFEMATVYPGQQTLLDKVTEHDGLMIYIDQASALYCDGIEVDYSGLQGSGFAFNGPAIKRKCGCGSSVAF